MLPPLHAALLTLCLAASVPVLSAPPGPGYHVLKKMPVSGDGGWDYLLVDSDMHRLYITHGTQVNIVDSETGAAIGEITNTPGVHGVALAPALGRGFISNGGDSTVTIFDLKSLKEINRVKVGSRPDAILYEPATKRVFTFNAGTSDTTALDAADGKVLGTIALGGKPEFAVSDNKGQVFVNIEDKSEIIAFDPKSLKVKHHWPIAPGEEASGLAIDRKHHRLFAVCSNEKMAILDYDNGHIVATPTIGKGPDAAAFDEETGLAFSSNGEDGTLTVIKEETPSKFTVVETVPTASGARTMTLDKKTHRVYVVTAKVKAASPGQTTGRRRGYEPGSFEAIVLGR